MELVILVDLQEGHVRSFRTLGTLVCYAFVVSTKVIDDPVALGVGNTEFAG